MGKYRNWANLKIWWTYQLFTELSASYTLVSVANTNKISKALGLKYQIPSWYRFGINIPKSWYPIDIFSTDPLRPRFWHYDVFYEFLRATIFMWFVEKRGSTKLPSRIFKILVFQNQNFGFSYFLLFGYFLDIQNPD